MMNNRDTLVTGLDRFYQSGSDTIYEGNLMIIKTMRHKVEPTVLREKVLDSAYTYTVDDANGNTMTVYISEWGDTFLLEGKPKKLIDKTTTFVEEASASQADTHMEHTHIKPTESKYLQTGDNRSASEIIGIVPQKSDISIPTNKLEYENMAQGMLLTFMLYITSIYIYRSHGYWSAMVKEINRVVVA